MRENPQRAAAPYNEAPRRVSTEQFDPKHPEKGWHPATPLPEPWLWRVWRWLRLMR